MLKIGERYYQLKIIRKNNQNIYLRIKGDVLEVTCPKNVTKESIVSFIVSKSGWIEKTIAKREYKNDNSKLIVDSSIYYLGKRYPFYIYSGKEDLRILDECIIIYCKDGLVEEALKVFYKENKKKILSLIYEKQDKYLRIIQDYGYHQIPDYKIKVLKSMWGVNYTKKNLVVINERLIHFDEKCLEAVLWHELLHFVLPNHSKRFHEVLEYHMPDYKKIIKSIY